MSFVSFSPADQLQIQRIAEHLVVLGPRAVAEALAEALATGDLHRLQAYRRLQPDVVSALGGDRFPVPVWAVPVASTGTK